MSKKRQGFPDGSVWVRTYPITFLHDYVEPTATHDWHQLTYASAGQLEVTTGSSRSVVPPDGAIWIPAGVPHGESMRAGVSARMLFIAPGAMRHSDRTEVQTSSVSPLLRELIAHIISIGALDRNVVSQRHLIGVLLDLIEAMPPVPMQLRRPGDPRATRLAELIEADPGDRAPLARLARRAGASLRTLERCFVEDTGLTLGQWRRRARLLASLRLLDQGMQVTQVADAVGYATASAFCAAFAREFGRTPSQRG